MDTLLSTVTSILRLITNRWGKLKSSKLKAGIAAIAAIYICNLARKAYWFMHRKNNSLPPGPNGLPLLGIISQWNKGTESRIELSKKYGPIFYSTLPGYPLVIISSSKLVKQLLPQKEFLFRPQIIHPKRDYYHSVESVGKSQAMSFIHENDDKWTQRRKLSQDTLFKILNNANVTKLLKQAMETEVEPYIEGIIKSNKAWYPRDIVEYITFNTIYATIFGKKISKNGQLFKQMNKDIRDAFAVSLINIFAVKVPFAKYIYGPRIDQVRNRKDECYLKLVNERMRDLKDKKMKKTSYVDHTHEMVANGDMTQDEEIADLFLLFIAGMDTTSSTLDFGVALLAKYQDIQQKVRKELFGIMVDGEFNLKLVNKCPLFRAAVHEILRISSVVFAGIGHITRKDYWVTLQDGKRYKIPKNTSIKPNIEYIHIYGGDKEHWKKTNGDEIVLENFLTEDDDGGIRFVMNESFVSFGVGKRDCVGRQLALKEIQYTLGYLLMNYEISLWNEEDRNRNISLMKKNNLATVSLDPKIPIKINKMNA